MHQKRSTFKLVAFGEQSKPILAKNYDFQAQPILPKSTAYSLTFYRKQGFSKSAYFTEKAKPIALLFDKKLGFSKSAYFTEKAKPIALLFDFTEKAKPIVLLFDKN